MDILDILLDILLKPPQPFIGLFLVIWCHFHKMTKMLILTELMACHEGIKLG